MRVFQLFIDQFSNLEIVLIFADTRVDERFVKEKQEFKRMIDYKSNQSYAIHDSSLLKLETRDEMNEFDDYLTIYLETLNEICETLEIDSENVVVVNDNDVSCELIIEKLVEILE